MASSIVLEVLDRRGRVRARQRLDRFPARVGRGYSCEVILDDPHVSPEHLEVFADEAGTLVVVDLGSENGTTWADSGAEFHEQALHDDMRLRVGRTELRVRFPDHPVPATVPMHGAAAHESLDAGRVDGAHPANADLPAWVTRRWPGGVSVGAVSLAVWLVVSAAALAGDYVTSYREVETGEAVGAFTVGTLGWLLWSGMWALGSRITGPGFRFGEHCLVAAVWTFVYFLAGPAEGYAAFASGADRAAQAFGWILQAVLLSGLLYSHLRLVSSARAGAVAVRAAAVSVTLTGLVAATAYTVLLGNPDLGWSLAYRSELKPPMFQLAPSRTTEDFFGHRDELRRRVDELAERSVDRPG